MTSIIIQTAKGHGLGKRVNKIDYTKRVLQFFDRYLMDKPAAKWITKGVPFLDKNKQKEVAESNR
ncbi:MAG: hypothetical protein FVQ82_00695 [Planctomycetes bacterium]|nr:hypothetical protein [Planctomycetota bacterium]